MRWQIIFATVSLAACLGTSTPQAGKSEQEAIQGAWQLVGGRKAGKDLTKETLKDVGIDQVMFQGNKMDIKGPVGTWESAATIKIDAAQTPKQIDLVFGKILQKGIYELAGDDLRIAFNSKDQGERPADFKSGELMILKRVKK